MTEASLSGNTVLIVGGATGIGQATSQLFGLRGADVLIGDYNEEEGAATAETIRAAGGRCDFFPMDVRLESSVRSAFENIGARTDRLNTLIYSAGILRGQYSSVADLEVEDWEATIDTNLKGTYLTTKYAAPLLIRAKTSVVLLISSGAGVRGGSSSLAYAASKAGMHGMQYNLEKDLPGARLHVVCPGGIATPLKLKNIGQGAVAQGGDPEAAIETARQSLGDPVGIARVLAFLASDAADYVRGTVFTR